MNKVVKMALAGGPRSGKSSSEKIVRRAMEAIGYHVIFVPEVATRIIKQYNVLPPKLPDDQYFAFQEAIFREQLEQERRAQEYANLIKGSGDVLIICDRGLMDCGSYMRKPEDFTRLLKKYGLNRVTAREGNYDSVFHLRTTAYGLEEDYLRSFKDNEIRYEATVEGAREGCDRALNAWLGHPHLRIIDNSTDFDGKMARLIAKMQRALGIPEPIETERKFLVHNAPDVRTFPIPAVPIEIYQNYLKDMDRSRIRVRSQENEGSLYYLTHKIPTASEMSAVEIERVIKGSEYWSRHRERDEDLDEIYKIRHYFIHNNQVLELDQFKGPKRHDGLWIMEAELDDEKDVVVIPDWLGPVTEVTTDKKYKNRKLAKRPE